jgi:hypothetical protein
MGHRHLGIVVAAAAGLGFLAVPSGAHAAFPQITYGPSTTNVTFTGLGAAGTGSEVAVDFGTGVSGTGTVSPSGNAGTFTFTPDTVVVNAPAGNNGILPVLSQGAQTFTFEVSPTDLLSGTVTWTFARDASPTPTLNGSLTVVTAIGSDFSTLTAGEGLGIDFTVNNIGTTVDALAGTTNSAGNTISSGEVSVPAPVVGAGLPGLVAACAGLLAFARRRRQKIA